MSENPSKQSFEIGADFYNLCCKEIVGKDIDGDIQEVTHHVHILQLTIMKQAAARAYPKKFRLLGKNFKK